MGRLTSLVLLRRIATGWDDAKQRVIVSYREWLRAVCDLVLLIMESKQLGGLNGLLMTFFCWIQSPEIQTMYSLNMPVSTIRTKIREEFERHRYVNQLKSVDVLLFQSHAEYQVWLLRFPFGYTFKQMGSQLASVNLLKRRIKTDKRKSSEYNGSP